MKKIIKNYWETRLPFGTKIKRPERYSQFYYLLKDAEFKEHKGEKVLEIGCGVGMDSLEYAKNGALVYGIDLTDSAIKLTKERFKLNNLKGDFKTMDAENLKFEDNTFDFVYSCGVLHHTPNTEKAIKEIKRVLKPDRNAVIGLYAKGWMYYIFFPVYFGIIRGDLFKMSWKELIHKHYEMEGNVPLVKVYSRKQINQLFDNIVKLKRRPLINSIGRFPPEFVIRLLERIWGGFWIIKTKNTIGRVYCKLKCEVENHPKEGCVFKYSSLEYIKKIKNSDCRKSPKTIERSFIKNQHNKKD